MKHLIYLASVITIMAFTTSCNKKAENKESNPKVGKTTEAKQAEEHQHEVNAIQLNNGKKWEANLETTEGIKKMQQIMQVFSNKESPVTYSSIKEDLETEFTNIFEKCTMKGEAHNQLHNYLKPMVILFDGLASSDQDTCKKSHVSLENHLLLYQNYFG